MPYYTDPTDLAFRPRVSYGTGPTVLDLSRPMSAWIPGRRDIGTGVKYPSGAREAYLVNRFSLIGLTIEFTEHEMPDVYDFVEYVLDNAAAFQFYPDQTDLPTVYSVYLNQPTFAEEWFPRQGQQLGLFELDMVLESSDGTRFDIRRFPAAV